MLPNEAMYPYTAKEARDRGELEVWRANFRTNCACAGAIELAIHRDFDGMYLKDGCAKSVIDQYSSAWRTPGKSPACLIWILTSGNSPQSTPWTVGQRGRCGM